MGNSVGTSGGAVPIEAPLELKQYPPTNTSPSASVVRSWLRATATSCTSLSFTHTHTHTPWVRSRAGGTPPGRQTRSGCWILLDLSTVGSLNVRLEINKEDENYGRGAPVPNSLSAERHVPGYPLFSHRNGQWSALWSIEGFRGGLVFKAHIILYHSTLGLRVRKKKEEGG